MSVDWCDLSQNKTNTVLIRSGTHIVHVIVNFIDSETCLKLNPG